MPFPHVEQWKCLIFLARERDRAGAPTKRGLLWKANIRIKLRDALGANPVAEMRAGSLLDVGFDIRPCSLVIADPFAGRADGQKPPQGMDLVGGGLQTNPR